MAETLTLAAAQSILGCEGCSLRPTHPLDNRPCSVWGEAQIIAAATEKGLCRKKPKAPKEKKYKIVT